MVKSGSTFAEWNTKADGSGTAYAVDGTFEMGTADVTLYAQWTLIPTYTVTYNGNGSTGGTVPSDATKYTASSTVTVKTAGTMVKSGYTFAGWNTKADGSGADRAAISTFSMETDNVTLVCPVDVIPKYTLIYNGNGALPERLQVEEVMHPEQV
jgi:uncharacterized repeat protein (TIGR02543 family)